jgi:hypothetical protein
LRRSIDAGAIMSLEISQLVSATPLPDYIGRLYVDISKEEPRLDGTELWPWFMLQLMPYFEPAAGALTDLFQGVFYTMVSPPTAAVKSTTRSFLSQLIVARFYYTLTRSVKGDSYGPGSKNMKAALTAMKAWVEDPLNSIPREIFEFMEKLLVFLKAGYTSTDGKGNLQPFEQSFIGMIHTKVPTSLLVGSHAFEAEGAELFDLRKKLSVMEMGSTQQPQLSHATLYAEQLRVITPLAEAILSLGKDLKESLGHVSSRMVSKITDLETGLSTTSKSLRKTQGDVETCSKDVEALKSSLWSDLDDTDFDLDNFLGLEDHRPPTEEASPEPELITKVEYVTLEF